MCYAENLLVARPNEVTPMHANVAIVEDIIKRGEATLAVELSRADPWADVTRKREDGLVRCSRPDISGR